MGRSPRVLRSAIVMAALLAAVASTTPLMAQVHESALRSIGYSPDPFARSPRLLGMGRLTLADDLHNRINLWDFAGNPTGIAEAESVSSFEYRPTTRSSSVMWEQTAGTTQRERQALAASQNRHAIETWRRAPGTPAYGLQAELDMLQLDVPFAESIEHRSSFTVPSIGGAVNGRVPWLKSDRFGYSLRLDYRIERQNEGYNEFLRLPQGDYLGKTTPVVPAPDLFMPNEVQTKGLGGGVGLSVRVTRDIKAAVNYDRAKLKVRGTQEGLRSTSKIEEDRPFDIGQASVVGRLGRHVEWGADGRAWQSQSEEFFFWSISAGAIQAPLSGSGKRLDRDEKGTSLRARARWTNGPVELGAGVGSGFRRAIVTPWFPTGPEDQPGFNDFLGEVGRRAGADTLMLPARVLHTQVEERSLEISAGGSWRLPDARGMLGAEFHHWTLESEQIGIGAGAKPAGWDIRAGGEYRCNRALLARAGWSYGISDRDDLTADNAYRITFATAGFGYQPVGSRWSVDLGYAYQWAGPDFVDPSRSQGTEQHLGLQVRWPF